MVPLRVVLGGIFLAALLGATTDSVRAEPPAGARRARDEAFFYPLRPGESLNDVSRIFRVPVEELATLNQITDPNRMAIGQMLKVPNGFARDAALLSAERDRLIAEARRLEDELAEKQRAIGALEKRVEELGHRETALENEVASLVQIRTMAKVAFGLLFVMVVWILKAHIDRARANRRLHWTEAENTALTTAKEKYRYAAAQLELRYQKLYRGDGETPRDVVADGIDRLDRAFRDGSAHIETLIAEIRENEGAPPEAQADRKARAWLFHPIRELLARQRL